MLVHRFVSHFLKQSDTAVKQAARTLSTISKVEETPQVNTQGEECLVCSYNEWDPLEEVIVGRPQGVRVPKLGPEIKVT